MAGTDDNTPMHDLPRVHAVVSGDESAKMATLQETINELVKVNSQLTQLLMTTLHPSSYRADTTPPSPPSSPSPTPAPSPVAKTPPTPLGKKQKRLTRCNCRWVRDGDDSDVLTADGDDDADEDDEPRQRDSPLLVFLSSLFELVAQIVLAVALVAWFLGGTLFTSIMV